MQFFKRDKKDEHEEDPIYEEPTPLVDRARAALAQNEPTDEERRLNREETEMNMMQSRPIEPTLPRIMESAPAPRLPEPGPRSQEPGPHMPEPAPRIPDVASRMAEPAPAQRFDPPYQRSERPSAPSQGKWNPEGERRPMNPVPRERLPYPDLPTQAPERPSDRPDRSDRSITRGGQPQQAAPRTVISRESNFNGNFRSDSDLLIEGTFEGEIDCKGTVIIAEGANVSATVRARNSMIAGSANGEFTCEERLTIQATGEMRGKAQAATLVVEEGAFFEGEFKMGAGGFTSISSNFSSWQTGRTTRNEPTRPGQTRTEDTPESAPDADASQGDNARSDQPESQPRRDTWS
jgi:cytoskeletal protein CcmA (bactofilin family)